MLLSDSFNERHSFTFVISSTPLVMQCGRSCCVHRDAGPEVVSVEVPR